MGLREILTKPIGGGSTVLQWSEPLAYRLRLRGDLWMRLLLVLGAWAGATGIMLGLFAINADPPGILTAIGLGLVFGFGPAVLLTTMLRDHVSGRVRIRRNDIRVQRQYASLAVFTGGWIEYAEWPWSTIQKCVIVPGTRINRSFSVMLLSIGGEAMIVGIPQKVDLKELTGFISRKGVGVTPGQSIPAAYRKPLNLFVGLSVPALAMLLFLTGSTFYLVQVGLPVGDRDQRLARHEQMNDVLDSIPRPPTLPQMPASRIPSPGRETPSTPQPEINVPDIPLPQSGPAPGFGGPSTNGVQPADGIPLLPIRPEPAQPLTGPGGNPIGSGRRGPSSPATPMSPDSSMSAGNSRTAAAGGSGGFPFETVDDRGRPVIGVRCRMGNWAGAERVGKLDPLFERKSPSGRDLTQLAREGYALGALDVSGENLVDAVRPVFMRLTEDNRLDPDDSYDGDWIGVPAEKSVTRLAGNGAAVIGFHGRGGAVLDAVGLVVRDAH